MGEATRVVLAEYLTEGNYEIRMRWPDFRQPPTGISIERDGVVVATTAPLTASEGAQDRTTEPGTEEALRGAEGEA